MINLEQINQLEKNISMSYLDSQVTTWGRMFSDIDNKESYASNYAVINKNEDLNNVIEEIEEYFNSKNIVPKIFRRSDSLELDMLRPYLERNYYKLREFDLELMIMDMSVKDYNIKNNNIKKCHINKVNNILSAQEYNLAIEQDNGDTYGVNLLNKQINAGNSMFFAYDEFNKPVSMALAEKYENVVYISNVYTTPLKRRKGYGISIINAILLYYKDSLLYLYSSNPDAISIYKQLGFSSQALKSWWAVKGSLPEWCQYSE